MLSNPNYFCTNIQSSDQKCYLGNILRNHSSHNILFSKHSYLLLSIIDIKFQKQSTYHTFHESYFFRSLVRYIPNKVSGLKQQSKVNLLCPLYLTFSTLITSFSSPVITAFSVVLPKRY